MNPWNIRAALLAKHAQHVVLIHFPIALFLTGILFDLVASRAHRRDLAGAAFWNLTLAAWSALPAAISGVMAWQWELDGRRLKGILLMHLLAGTISLLLITAVWILHAWARRRQLNPPMLRWPLQAVTVLAIAVTGYLGGFLSGVNHPQRQLFPGTSLTKTAYLRLYSWTKVCPSSLEASVRRFSLPVLLFVVGFALVARADDWSKTYDLTGQPELRVEANDANIHIEPWDQNKIEAHVTTRGWHIGVGSGSVEIVDHQQGNAVEIDVREHSHGHISFGIDSRRIDVDIHMPRSGKVDARTEDGRIEAHGLAGDMTFTSSDGRIEVADLDGNLRAHTSDGAVRASGRFDRVDLRTSDGHVELEARPGSQLREDWEVRTSDGSVRVSLPANLAANLNLHTGDGHITTDFPITVQGSYDKANLRGTINGGGRELIVHTGDGSITLQKS